MSKSLKTECKWIISGWKEKELSFKPIDIANNIPFNFCSTGEKSQVNTVAKEGADAVKKID